MTRIRTALLATAAAALTSAAALAEDATAPAHMSVTYDQSALLRLDRPAKTVIVGNPAIADAQLVNDHTIYVLGRMFGNTNIIAVDGDGAEVSNTVLTVSSPQMAQVTVWRGAEGQRNLACAPMCERTLTQGDADFSKIHTDDDKKVEVSQKAAARAKIAAQALWPDPIVTEVSPLTKFYVAEKYHQDYFRNNPNQGYCTFVIKPKMKKLEQKGVIPNG